MSRRDVEAELLDQPGQAGSLALGQGEHESRQGGRVDDRMGEWALQAAPDEPGVERVVTVLDQDRPLGEAEKRATRVLELRGAYEHRAVDVMAAARVGVDGRPAVDERVEEGERATELEALGPDFEHQERRVARGLDVERDELRLFEPRFRADLGGVDRNLLPRHQLRRAAGLEEKRFVAHLASASARRAQAISSRSSPRSTRTATP